VPVVKRFKNLEKPRFFRSSFPALFPALDASRGKNALYSKQRFTLVIVLIQV